MSTPSHDDDDRTVIRPQSQVDAEQAAGQGTAGSASGAAAQAAGPHASGDAAPGAAAPAASAAGAAAAAGAPPAAHGDDKTTIPTFAPTELQTQRVEHFEPTQLQTTPMQTPVPTEVMLRPPPPPRPAASTPQRPAAEHGNALPVGTYLNEFEITGVLGEGGFGIVYLAQDHSLQRRVALKEYMPSALAARTGDTTVAVKSERHRETFELGLKSFVNEARLLAQFDHPSLVKVYRFWEDNGTAYMVMPFYEGITLKDKLREMGEAPDEAWLMGLLAPLTQALQVIHAQQCYHRDIAPDNIILLAGSGRPLLLDFGAARRVIGDMTQALTVILKPGYAPLEQYAEVPGMKQGPWTDVYALAAVVYYAILRKTPPPAVGRMVDDTYVPLAQAAAGRYSDSFLLAVDQALRVRPEQRPQSIDELRALLDLPDDSANHAPTVIQGQGVTQARRPPAAPTPAPAPAFVEALAASPVPAPAPKPAAGRSPMLWVGGGAAVVLALAAGGYWALTPRDTGVPAAAGPSAAPAPQPGTQATAPATTAPPPPAATPAASPPAVAVTAPPPAAEPPTMSAEFDRAVQAQSPGFDVQATPTRSKLRIDRDPLAFKVRSAKEGFVYVIANDPDGSTTLLFPNTESSNNRIAAGQTLSLPQASWPVLPTEPQGEERFLVIVSEAKRDFSSIGTPAGWFQSLKLGNAAGTGTIPAIVGRAQCGTPGCEAYGAARFSVQIVR